MKFWQISSLIMLSVSRPHCAFCQSYRFAQILTLLSVSVENTNLSLVKGLASGISNGNVLVANAAVADNDFLKIAGTSVEGRTVAEVLSDLNVEAGADVTDAANVLANLPAGVVSSSAFPLGVTPLDAEETLAVPVIVAPVDVVSNFFALSW